jgi:hypothetical protein
MGKPSDVGKLWLCGVNGLSKASSSLATTIMVRNLRMNKRLAWQRHPA